MKAPLQLVVEPHRFERRSRLGARQPVGASARQLAAFGRLVDVGWAQRVGLDTGLIDQHDPAGRAGSENEFGAADHVIPTTVADATLPSVRSASIEANNSSFLI